MTLADVAGVLAEVVCFYCGDPLAGDEVVDLEHAPGWSAHVDCAVEHVDVEHTW